MEEGFQPDTRSANVADLRVTSANGKPLITTYDKQHGRWTLPVQGGQYIDLSYIIHLSNVRTLPTWAHLQYGLFDNNAGYFVTKEIFIVPDSLDSAESAGVSITTPAGSDLAAPWIYDSAQRFYRSTIAALVNNSIVVGSFEHVHYRVGNFSITVALLGKWAEQRDVVERVIRTSVARDLRLFSETPADQYLISLVSGDEDGQSYTTSNAISTRLAINLDDTEIWANNITHELFHHWNARLLHTSDKRLAFLVEGFTEYYANREILAESLINQQRYWNMAAFHLGAYSYFNYSPNYEVSLAQAGLDKTKNRFGVYDGGWVLALCLDLELRAESKGDRSLDDLMKFLWRHYGRTNEPFTFNEFAVSVSTVMGHDMTSFFEQFVTGRGELPFRRDLTGIGVTVYDQPFGGEAYIKVNPRVGAERLAYENFLANGTR